LVAQHLIDQWIAKVFELPAREQVKCVLIALQPCAPIAAGWADAQKLGDPFRKYAGTLHRWLTGEASDRELEKAAHPLDRRLNREIESEQDLPGAMAAHAFLDTVAIALGYSPEVGDEIIRTAVFFASAASTGSRDVPVEVDADRLTPTEQQFIQDWWRECAARLPELLS